MALNTECVCPSTLTGIEVCCEGSAGGIKRVLVSLKDNVTINEATIKTNNEAAVGTDIVNASGKTFVEYKFRPQTGSMTSTATIDAAIGSSSISTVLSLQFTRMEKAKRIAIQEAINAGSVIIVQDFNGNSWLLKDCYCTGATGVTGQAVGDLNGYTLEITDVAFEMPYPVSGDINTLLAA